MWDETQDTEPSLSDLYIAFKRLRVRQPDLQSIANFNVRWVAADDAFEIEACCEAAPDDSDLIRHKGHWVPSPSEPELKVAYYTRRPAMADAIERALSPYAVVTRLPPDISGVVDLAGQHVVVLDRATTLPAEQCLFDGLCKCRRLVLFRSGDVAEFEKHAFCNKAMSLMQPLVNFQAAVLHEGDLARTEGGIRARFKITQGVICPSSNALRQFAA